MKGELFEDGLDRVIAQARHLQAQGSDDPETVEDHLGFLDRHRAQIRSGTYPRMAGSSEAG